MILQNQTRPSVQRRYEPRQQCAPERLAVMEMTDVAWSDWGTPDLIVADLDNIGKGPAVAEDPLPFLYQG